jgi:hypothetical protein
VLLDLGCRADEAEVVPQPLHQRPGDGDGTLQRADRVVGADLVAGRGEQAVSDITFSVPVLSSMKLPVP